MFAPLVVRIRAFIAALLRTVTLAGVFTLPPGR
jgi:hypothetical protein